MASASQEEALEDFRKFSFRSVLTKRLVGKSISTITTLLDSNVSPEVAAELSRIKDYLTDIDDASQKTYAVSYVALRHFLEVEDGDAARITQEETQEFELLESQESVGGGGQGDGAPGGSGGGSSGGGGRSRGGGGRKKKGGAAAPKKKQGNHEGETPPKVCLRYSAGVLNVHLSFL